MDFRTPPLSGCTCSICGFERTQQAKRAWDKDRFGGFAPFDYGAFKAKLDAVTAPLKAPEPEPAPEPAYTHVLLDYSEDGTPDPGYAELHTAESLLEAIELRKDGTDRYQVFKLGDSILDVAGS